MEQDESLHVRASREQCEQCLVKSCACHQRAEAERRMQDSAKNTIRCPLREQKRSKTKFNDQNDLLGRLPIEVVIHIFAFCIDRTETSSIYRTFEMPSKKLFHFTLGEVCCTWRHIVWSYPHFWKEIPIFLQQCATSPSQVAFFQERIDRSGQLPLSVWINLKMDWLEIIDVESDLTSSIIDPLIPMLNSVAHRWLFLYAKIPSIHLSQLRLENERGSQLKELILQPIDDHEMEIEDRRFDLGVPVCPQVLQVSCYELQNLRLEWNNLTDFHGSNLSRDDCVALFEWAPQLLKCNLSDLMFTDSDVFFTKHVVNFTVKTFLIDAHEEIFSALTLPALQELHCGLSEDDFAHVLSDFVVRSGCNLEAASFSSSNGDDHDLIDFLYLIPSLKRLTLSDIEIGHTFLSRLGETSFVHTDDNATHLLPHLQHFDYCYLRYFEWSSVADMSPIVSPQPGMVRRRLNSIHFEIECELERGAPVPGAVGWPKKRGQVIDRKTLERMLEIIDSGVDLRIIEVNWNRDIIQVSKKYHRLGVD
ncbi:hypothetical protein CPB83DRAFT_315944 [Crepidotus variabilis]|uniref:F-box domain-containing protein n=1 Tax=Crepidotus variabilis TaxID=179855 RepID=A0A9P6EGM6_9AGAR|nr:hypothetical protein CPB83DRAFT_315944 [Crepidotus variabilis]